MPNSLIQTYLAASPSLDPAFVEIRRQNFESVEQPWVMVDSLALFSSGRSKIAGVSTTVLSSALGWDMRPWLSSDFGGQITPRLLDELSAHQGWNLCQMTCLSDGEVESLKNAASRGFSICASAYPVAVISETKSYAQYLEKRSASANKNQRRAVRRAKDAGLEFRSELLWSDICQIMDARAVDFSTGADYTKMPEFRKFLKEFREEMIGQGRWVEVGLYDGARPVSYDLGFWSGRVFHSYQTAFDPAYAKARAGSITFEKSIERVLDQGCDLFEMMGDNDYFRLFTKETLELQRVNLFSRRLKGRALATLMSLKSKTLKK